jgi:predicted transcriptional regulator
MTTTVEVSQDTNQKRETFFRLVFGQNDGYVCIAFLSGINRKDFREEFFRYPAELPQMLEAINIGYRGYNVYFCPQLLRERARKKEHVQKTPNIWADLDTCGPELLLVEPSVVLETSPGRYQGFWIADREIDPDDAEDISRRIAYRHADQGADRSGWDLTQLLRVPLTYNYKYESQRTPVVSVIHATRARYRVSDFEVYPQVSGYHYFNIPMPAEEDLVRNADDLLNERRNTINPTVWALYNQEPTSTSWSEPLWNLQMLLFEAGYARDEVYIIAREAKCNKYARDGRPAHLLWKEVCRAEARAQGNEDLLRGHLQPQEGFSMLTPEERHLIENGEDTFIERYYEWAKSLGDAAPQYHKAGAFIALSSLLAGAVRLPTSFGTILPNLWFMILADTTLTRKTTAMDITMDMVMEIDPDVVMATDGSIEGLLTSLASRPGKPSVFLRDEFSGLLEQMTKKDYMAGMPELLTKLYDGKMQKRILRKETIEVKEPVLIFFAGGIKNKITQLLNFEMVSSGFMPRFVFVTAESDISKLKPLGPPTERTTGNREAIRQELEDIYSHYRKTQTLEVKQLKTTIEQVVRFDAQLTPEAWLRYNQLENDMLSNGLKSERPEIMTPVHDRLSKSILKAAVLLAAARQRRPDNVVMVEVIDIVRAMYYGEGWKTHVGEVMEDVGKSGAERQMGNILGAIIRKPGVSRSSLMQSYHLDARGANLVFETMEQRGLITRTRAGRTEQLFPTTKGSKTYVA